MTGSWCVAPTSVPTVTGKLKILNGAVEVFSHTRVVDQSEHTGLFGRTGLHEDLWINALL